MVSKLKQRRLRRLKADVTWWRAEAEDWKQVAMEHAATIDMQRSQVIRVPMPVIVPAEIACIIGIDLAGEKDSSVVIEIENGKVINA